MGWIIAVILVLLGIGLIAAGFNGNALSFFDAFTGIVTPSGSSSSSASAGSGTGADQLPTLPQTSIGSRTNLPSVAA
jgi:hypothetical protein